MTVRLEGGCSIQLSYWCMIEMVLEEGLEPSRSFEQKILSLLCLPIPPPEQLIV